MRQSYNGSLSQPSKLMTRVRLPSTALKAHRFDELFLCLYDSAIKTYTTRKFNLYSIKIKKTHPADHRLPLKNQYLTYCKCHPVNGRRQSFLRNPPIIASLLKKF